jgi:hypothetical protein
VQAARPFKQVHSSSSSVVPPQNRHLTCLQPVTAAWFKLNNGTAVRIIFLPSRQLKQPQAGFKNFHFLQAGPIGLKWPIKSFATLHLCHAMRD